MICHDQIRSNRYVLCTISTIIIFLVLITATVSSRKRMRATDLFRLIHFVIDLLAVAVVIAQAQDEGGEGLKDVPMTVTFVNEMPHTVSR